MLLVNVWLRWLLPATVLLVLGLSLWAWRTRPLSTMVARTRATSSATLAAPTPDPLVAWELHLRLDPDLKPPGPEWMLHEGKQPGEGYELHWLPTRLGLQIFRIGEQVLLLGSATLNKAPGEVVFSRRGLRLAVHVDGKLVLDCVDPLAGPAPTMLGFQAAAALGDALVSLHAPAAEPTVGLDLISTDLPTLAGIGSDAQRPDQALAQVRYALLLDPQKATAAADVALAAAQATVDGLDPQNPDRSRLRSWLAWGRLRTMVARQDIDAAAAAATAPELRPGPVGQHGSPGELPGLLLQLLPAIAARACTLPQNPTPPVEVLRSRIAWLGLLAEIGYSAMDLADPNTSDYVHWQLRLVVHGGECLIGKTPQPTPAEAPMWVTSRWRAFAGRNPTVGEFPALPGGWQERNPVQPALEKLVRFAIFEPLPALAMCARIRDALEHQNGDGALAALKEAPIREAVLARALLALRGVGSMADARDGLNAALGDQLPWTASDPLAYALDKLLVRRVSGIGENEVGKVPAKLVAFELLLSGKPDATQVAWMHAAEVLPPAQALATALAMQEVAGLAADWSLIERFPCYTLPLTLMVPRRKPAENTDSSGAATGDAAKP